MSSLSGRDSTCTRRLLRPVASADVFCTDRNTLPASGTDAATEQSRVQWQQQSAYVDIVVMFHVCAHDAAQTHQLYVALPCSHLCIGAGPCKTVQVLTCTSSQSGAKRCSAGGCCPCPALTRHLHHHPLLLVVSVVIGTVPGRQSGEGHGCRARTSIQWRSTQQDDAVGGASPDMVDIAAFSDVCSELPQALGMLREQTQQHSRLTNLRRP